MSALRSQLNSMSRNFDLLVKQAAQQIAQSFRVPLNQVAGATGQLRNSMAQAFQTPDDLLMGVLCAHLRQHQVRVDSIVPEAVVTTGSTIRLHVTLTLWKGTGGADVGPLLQALEETDKDVRALLVAAVLDSEDDCISFSDASILRADNYELKLLRLKNEKKTVLTAEERK